MCEIYTYPSGVSNFFTTTPIITIRFRSVESFTDDFGVDVSVFDQRSCH